MICPHCGAQLPSDGRCWNCSPAIAVPEESVPEINVHHIPEKYRETLDRLHAVG